MKVNSSAGSARIWRVAQPLFYLTCFVLVSRVFDIARQNFKLPAILLGLLAIGLIASRRSLIFFGTVAGKILAVFVAWVLLTFSLATRGPQSAFYLQTLLVGALLFAAAAGLFTTVSGFNKLFGFIAYAGLTAAFLGIFWSGQQGGRSALRGGPYSDPNYYAMWLLALTPLIWTAVPRKPFWLSLLGRLSCLLPLFLFVRTGSRAGAISLGAMAAVLLILAPLTTRILIATVAAVAAVALVAFVPASLRTRLAPSAQRGADTDSSTARETLLATSVAVTLSNPLFGVGPGNFPFVVVEEGRSRGQEFAPLNTHNAYTQISSETGIPGFILFLLLIGFSLKNVISLLRESAPRGPTPDAEIHHLVRGLLLSLAGLLTFMLFLSEGYNAIVLLWLGIAAGLRKLLPPSPNAIQPEEVFAG